MAKTNMEKQSFCVSTCMAQKMIDTCDMACNVYYTAMQVCEDLKSKGLSLPAGNEVAIRSSSETFSFSVGALLAICMLLFSAAIFRVWSSSKKQAAVRNSSRCSLKP